MSEERSRKLRVCVNPENFEQVKRLYKIKTKKELMEITNLGISALNSLIKKFESNDGDEEPTYNVFYGKSGRKKNKNEHFNKICFIMGNDNSLTLRGCKEKLTTPVSISQLSRNMKGAGLSRKRIKKKANVLQTQRSIDNR